MSESQPPAPRSATPMRSTPPPAPRSSQIRPSGTSQGDRFVPMIDPIRVVRQYFWWLVASVIIGAFVGVVGHFVWARTSPVYRAAAVFEVPVQNAEVMGSGTIAGGQSSEHIERQLNTQAARMVDEAVLRQAVDSPDVRNNTEWIKQFASKTGDGIEAERALKDLKQRVRSKPFSGSFQIELSMTGSKPADLKRILDAVSDVYLRQLRNEKQQERSNRGAAFITERRELETSLNSLERTIETYMTENGLTADPRTNPIYSEVETLTAMVSENQYALASLQAQDVVVRERMEDPNRVYTDEELAIADMDSQVLALESEITALQTEIRAAADRFGPNHRFVQSLKSRVAAAAAERAMEMERVLDRNLRVQSQRIQTSKASIEQVLVTLSAQLQRGNTRMTDIARHVAWLNTSQTEQETLLGRIADIDKATAELNIWSAMEQTDKVVLRRGAFTPDTPTMPRLILMLPLGVILVSGLTASLIFIREITDRRVKGPSDISILPNGRVIGVIPHLSEDSGSAKRVELINRSDPNSVISESVRQSRTPILRAMQLMDHKTLMIAGAQPGSGSTAYITNLAICAANSGEKVLVVDANFRRPKIAAAFGLQTAPGLGELLDDQTDLSQAVQVLAGTSVSVLTAGSGKYRIFERLSGPRFQSFLAAARAEYDIVLIDAPAAVVAGECQVLAQQVDATILVVRAMKEERGLVARLMNQLRDANAEHLGIVLNGVRCAAGGYFKQNIKQMQRYQSVDSPSSSNTA